MYGTTNLHTGTGLVERTIQSLKNLILANIEDDQNLRESVNRALHVVRFTRHSEIKKNPFELHFKQTPRTKKSNLKNSISAKKKMAEPKYKRGTTFSQTKKQTSSVSTNKFEYPFKLYEKNYKKRSMEKKFKNKVQTAASGTKHTLTTDKNKTIHRKLISNPLPFEQATSTPAKRKNTHQNAADQRTCSKTLDIVNNGGAPCIYSRKEAP